MNRNNTWKWALVVFLVAWSLWELYPPTNQDLIEVFKSEAVTTDVTFNNIVKRAQELREQDRKASIPENAYLNLKNAVGTNEIRQYFTTYDVTKEKDPNAAILNHLQRKAAGKIKLGLDLRGGTSFLMGMDTTHISTNVDKGSALSQAVEVLRRRVDKLGVAEPLIQPVGEDRILVQLPGISDVEKESARRQLQQAAFLEFRMVHPRSAELLSQGIIEPGYEKLVDTSRRESSKGPPQTYLVKKKPEHGLTGKYVTQAFATRDPVSNKPEILFKMNSEGADLFYQVTKENVGNQLAIVLDGELYSAPNINGPIPGGNASITGDFTPQEAHELANVLENPLEAPVKILEERSVDPSLGKDAVSSGFKAAVGGVIAVAGFMAVYYMLAGMVANVALITNIIILLGVMCSIGTTLTLPGIAGIVLTVGMAVDANVLIFERIREELGKGKSLRGALNAGYDRAFGTIFDSHVTTLISSIILIYMGTGSIKGFGVALTIGVAASLFTALVVTRLIFDFMFDRGMLKSLKMFHVINVTNLDFMKFAKPAFILSWSIILIGIAVGFTRGEKLLGVDFAGGDDLSLRFSQKIDTEEVRKVITQAGVPGDSQIQYQKAVSGSGETLRITSKVGTGKQVEQALQKAFPNAGFKEAALDTVGPVIGEEIQRSALIASLLSLFGILIYVAFRYEFSFAVGAVIAVLHDVLMTIGCYCLANYISGRQFNATVVAAILTIIGFSINDTIVIFDRIREDLKLGVRGTFKELINQALNQTLSRTIITSGTVFLATLSLYIFGGGAINDFAFTFLVGIITGTYSSIYIASALVLWWHKGERPKTATTVAVGNTAEARV